MQVKTTIIGGSVFLLLVLFQPLATAQAVKKRPLAHKPLPKIQLNCKQPGHDMPDLIITNVVLAKSDYFTITVHNKGLCPANASVLAIFTGKSEEDVKKPDSLGLWEAVPSLNGNQSYTYELYSEGSWGLVHDQKYFFRFVIDYYFNHVLELDEYNNDYIVTP